MAADKFSFSELDKSAKRGKRRLKRGRASQIFHVIFQAVYWLILASIGVGFGLMFVLSRDLPDVKALEDYEPSLPTLVFDRNGELITQFRVERRTLRPMSAMPQFMLDATVSIEDERFYKHSGVDPEAIARAAWHNLKAGYIVEGGSTLTQQLSRELFLTKERTILRKLKEQLLAVEIEKSYTKEEILYFYLNQVYYGHNAYGVEAAANVYFDKSVEELTVGEAAMIAGMVKNPAGYSPFIHPEAAEKRRNTVLYKMNELGYIDDEEYERARNTPITPAEMEREPDEAPYFSEYIRRILIKRYGSERIFRDGLKVYTTLDLGYQRKANECMEEGLARIEKNHPLTVIRYKDNLKLKELERGQVRYGRITEITGSVIICDLGGGITGTIDSSPAEWSFGFDPEEKFKVGDEIGVKVNGIYKRERKCILGYEERPYIQGSIVVIQPSTGDILAMVGGSDFKESKFNRAVQSKRQPGSSFKVFVYTSALDNGFSPADVFLDAPFKIESDGVIWTPRNYSRGTSGPMTMRRAIEQSINIVAVRVIDQVGVETVADYAHRMGIKSELVPVYSLALGTSDVTLLEMTSAFGTLANYGVRTEPRAITKIEDRHGNVLEEFPVDSEVVLEKSTCTVMINLMQGVIDRGTASLARRHGFKGPGAGKTGTTDEAADTWFVGFTPNDIACGVWVGRDDHERLSRTATGESYAVPIWAWFMAHANEGKEDRKFEAAEGVVSARICEESGLLATSKCTKVITEAFMAGTTPTKFCDIHDSTSKWELHDSGSRLDVSNEAEGGEEVPVPDGF